MASSARDIFITGLRNAHAMETQARELMERQSERLTDYPEVQARMKTHLGETEGQLKRLDQCLSSLGESASAIKDTTQSFMGNMMAMAHSVAGDEILKNTFANNAFENFEIAAYKSLLALCGPAGADSAKPLLEQSFMGNMMAMAHSVAGDEILKNTFANNAAYKSLLALCGPAGADSAKPLLEQSLKEEEAMAAWVDQNVGKVTLAYLAKEQRAAA
jgi:ferritin-like metal-binding protein YciE